jgi:hypothetical protein
MVWLTHAAAAYVNRAAPQLVVVLICGRFAMTDCNMSYWWEAYAIDHWCTNKNHQTHVLLPAVRTTLIAGEHDHLGTSLTVIDGRQGNSHSFAVFVICYLLF